MSGAGDTRPSWVATPPGTDFPVRNLPYGVFTRRGSVGEADPRVGVAIGDYVLDLSSVDVVNRDDFAEPTLNTFLSRGRPTWTAVRSQLITMLTDPAYRPAIEPHLVPMADVSLRLPFEVADYVDFYASEHHATNVGKMFRPDSDPLTPNWKHLPIGYHGRAGTVVVSATPITRPSGQRKAPDQPAPTFAPTGKLDIEAELGFVVGVGSDLGAPVAAADFADHVFGVVLLNDWSARDIQAWEYVPLGPFLGKSFGTSISPWVVPLAALEHARVPPPAQNPTPLSYLRLDQPWGLDLDLEIEWNGTVVSRPPFRQMYWTGAQMMAHLTANGAALRTGDLFASGTISGPEIEQLGSFLELTWNGTRPVTLADGTQRTFLADGDTVTIRGSAIGVDGVRLGLGSVTGTIVPGRE